MAGVMCEAAVKRPRLDESDYYDESSNGGMSCSDESKYSYQGYETAWVKDSGDDWSPSSSSEPDSDATDVIYEVEYEIASGSSTNQDDGDSEGSSDIDAVIMPIIAATCNLDDECLAGSESSEDGIIRTSPISPPKDLSDRWKCLRCGILNVPPMRYCHKCYEIRKGWLDPRPKRRRAKRARADSNRSLDSALDAVPSTSSATSTASSASSRPIDSGVSSQSSQEDPAFKQPCPCNELCSLCCVKRPDGVFVHGSTAHQIYCFSCSKRIWREKKKCPVCRRTIAKVVKVFRMTSS